MKATKMFLSSAVATVVLLFSACDVIEDPIIPTLTGFRSDLYEIPEFTPNQDNGLHVVLEEFTGHECGNCPGATRWISEYAADKPWIHLVGIHAGSLALPTAAHPFDITTPVGESYFEQIGSPGNPVARINRMPDPTAFKVRAQWVTEIESQLNTISPPIKCQVKSEIYPADHPTNTTNDTHLNILAHFEGISDYTGSVKFTVFVLENNIIGHQLNYTPPNGDNNYPPNASIPYYPHKHVLRSAVNGAWGTNLTESLTSDYSDVKPFTFIVPQEWNIEELEIVVFASDEATGQILNACSAHAVVK